MMSDVEKLEVGRDGPCEYVIEAHRVHRVGRDQWCVECDFGPVVLRHVEPRFQDAKGWLVEHLWECK